VLSAGLSGAIEPPRPLRAGVSFAPCPLRQKTGAAAAQKRFHRSRKAKNITATKKTVSVQPENKNPAPGEKTCHGVLCFFSVCSPIWVFLSRSPVSPWSSGAALSLCRPLPAKAIDRVRGPGGQRGTNTTTTREIRRSKKGAKV